MVSDVIKIRCILLYEFRKGSKAAMAHRNICQVFGQTSISLRNCQLWFQKFRSGNFDLENQPKTGRPTVIDEDQLRAVIFVNPSITIRELEQLFNVTYNTISCAVRRLGLVRKMDQWMPSDDLAVRL